MLARNRRCDLRNVGQVAAMSNRRLHGRNPPPLILHNIVTHCTIRAECLPPTRRPHSPTSMF